MHNSQIFAHNSAIATHERNKTIITYMSVRRHFKPGENSDVNNSSGFEQSAGDEASFPSVK